jgi:NTP pyrophosphatase (non-canonical NTP hydrolase)
MTLAELQATVDTWICRNGGYWDKFQILARLTEELGETASALQRQEGVRPRKVEADLGGEVGDLLFTLAAFANAAGIDLEKCVGVTLEKYDTRDAQDWQKVKTKA